MDEIDDLFEEWAIAHKFNITIDEKTVDENGRNIYSNPMTQGAYMAYLYAMDIAGACIRSIKAGSAGQTIN